MLDVLPRHAPGAVGFPPIRLTLIGRMRASDAAGRNILPRNRKTCALLAILALAHGAPVPRSHLAGLLWSAREPEQARVSLRQCVHELQERLQSCLPDALVATRAFIALRSEAFVMDVPGPDFGGPERMIALIDHGTLGEGGTTLLSDFAGLDECLTAWLVEQRRRLARHAVAVAEAALATAPSQPALLLAAAERVLRVAPTREAACRAAMSAHAGRGDGKAAELVFSRFAAALARADAGPPSADIRALAEQLRGAAPSPQTSFTPPVGVPRPRIRQGDAIRLGVLPFRPLGSGPDVSQEAALCAGLAEEITTSLARFRGIFLIASSSLSAAASPGPDVRSGLAWMREELGLDFVLDGTVQRAERMRVTVRLLDLRNTDGGGPISGGELVWSRRFERPAVDLLALQDEIAAETVAQVDPELMLRAGRQPNLAPGPQIATASAHALLLRAIPALYRMEEHSFRSAGDLLSEAVARDPGYAAAHGWFAYWQVFLVGQGWAADPEAAITRARELADRAVSLDPSDARGLAIAGHVRAFNGRSIDEALVLHERAIDLNPNLPLAWALAGLCLSYAGKHELGERRIEQARKLSPFDPHGFFFDTALALPLLLTGRYAEALAACRRAATMNPTFSSTYKIYLAALGHLTHGGDGDAYLGDMAEVRGQLERLEPDFTLSGARARSPLRRPVDLEVFLEGLRKGGLRLS